MTKRKTPQAKRPTMQQSIDETARLNGVGRKDVVSDDRFQYERLATFNNAISSGFRGKELYQLGEYLGLGKAPAPPAPAGGVPAVFSPRVCDERREEDDEDFGDGFGRGIHPGASGESGPNAEHVGGDGDPGTTPWDEDRA